MMVCQCVMTPSRDKTVESLRTQAVSRGQARPVPSASPSPRLSLSLGLALQPPFSPSLCQTLLSAKKWCKYLNTPFVVKLVEINHDGSTNFLPCPASWTVADDPMFASCVVFNIIRLCGPHNLMSPVSASFF